MSALEGTTELPGVGKVKKAYVVTGGALVAGIVGYAWWSRSRSQSEASAPDFYADTRTGSDLPGDGYANPGGIDTSGDQADGKAPKTDPEWAQAVLEKLTWYEPGYVSGIVAKYLAAQLLTATEANVIREAWAQVGKPPGGQQIRTGPTGPTGPVVTTPPARPTPTGQTHRTPPAAQTHRTPPSRVAASKVTRSSVLMSWGPPPGPNPPLIGYRLYENGKLRLRTLPGSPATLPGLKPNTTYRISVAAVYPGWAVGPMSTITVKTAK